MSEPEYMTGRELFTVVANEIRKTRGHCHSYYEVEERERHSWNSAAAIIKAPRTPKPKTLAETFREWSVYSTGFDEATIETLRVLLNEARQKMDGGL